MKILATVANTPAWLGPVLAAAANPPQAGPNPYVVWGLILLGVAVLLFFLEIFVPSGGVIGVCAVLAGVAGIVLFFHVDTTLGLIGAIIALIAAPFFFAFAIKLWPHTPIGRLLILKDPQSPEGRSGPTAQAGPAESSLVGRVGKALSDLRPVGTCVIDGKRLDCLSEHGVINAGTRVRVVSAEGMQIKVRPEKS